MWNIFKVHHRDQQHVYKNEATDGNQRFSPFSSGTWSFIHNEQHPSASGVSVCVVGSFQSNLGLLCGGMVKPPILIGL